LVIPSCRATLVLLARTPEASSEAHRVLGAL
jgi:hypothetical protein